MTNLDELNWLDEAVWDLILFRNEYRAYSPEYQWQRWIRSV